MDTEKKPKGVPDDEPEDCQECRGLGECGECAGEGFDPWDEDEDCMGCEGDGCCTECNGTGKANEE